MEPQLFGDIALLPGFHRRYRRSEPHVAGAESRLRRDLKAEMASVREEGTLGRARLETRIDALRADLDKAEHRLGGRTTERPDSAG